MHISVGKRRSVVQDEHGGIGPELLDRVVEPDLLPMRHPAGFTLRKAGAHRKIRFRKLQRVFQVLSHAG
jgi:hypothetical protein